MNLVRRLLVLLVILFLAYARFELGRKSSPVRYRCVVTREAEILCFQPDGAIFRPERRFDHFVLEVPR